jgi:phosphomannomutase
MYVLWLAVMITASHNPYIWNGFKYKPEYAGSASPEVVAALEKGIHRMQAGDDKVVRKPLAKLQQAGVVEWFDPVPTYLEHLKQLVDPEPIKNAGLNLVVDAMFGAGMGFFPKLLSGGKTRLSEIHHVHNPLFPGLDHPEPIDQNLEGLREAVLREHAGAGVANDGDADRVGFMDENGVFINQLQVFALLLLYLLEVRGWRGPVVRTVTTTVMADKLARKYNLPIFVTPVGFKYVGPKMIETNAIMGGEESGGFGFRGHIPERDGVVAGMFLLDFMVQTGKTPSQLIEHLYSIVGAHYYERIDVAFSAEQRKQIMQHVKDHAPGSVAGLKVTGLDTEDGFKFDLEDGGWLLIRFSGTEPVLRIYCETTHQDKVQDLLQEGYKMTGLPKKG